jgi:hypothetical protein
MIGIRELEGNPGEEIFDEKRRTHGILSKF